MLPLVLRQLLLSRLEPPRISKLQALKLGWALSMCLALSSCPISFHLTSSSPGAIIPLERRPMLGLTVNWPSE